MAMEHYREAPAGEIHAHAEDRWLASIERSPPTDVLEILPSPPGTLRMGLGRRKLLGLSLPLRLLAVSWGIALLINIFAPDIEAARWISSALASIGSILLLAVCAQIAFWHRDREWVEIDGSRLVVRRKATRRAQSAAVADVERAIVVEDAGVVQVLGPSPCLVVAEGLGHDLAALQWITRMINFALNDAREQPDARL